ncbi:MAG: methyltransferase domain-containing protein [Oscillospiraceae bacterium]|nr:50S rRNA methyltransferase [Ruminococcaceae bacterium BL-4]
MGFICPICKGPLFYSEKEHAFRCPKGHSYDLASEGYLYLLPPNRKHSKMPGDDKKMVAARKRCLERGTYQIFGDALSQIASRYLSQKNSPVILDAGCGEGWYTNNLKEALLKEGKTPEVFGFDISKFAVKAAARHYPGISFAVGSSFEIPFPDCGADLLLDVFSPVMPQEFLRVVEPGGIFLLAVPGERHLFGYKEILYEHPYENEHRKTEYDGFSFLERIPVRGELELNDKEAIMDLFAMTPYAWKTPREGVERLEQTETLKTEIAFDWIVYRKN